MKRIPAIDGIRGLAAMAVLLFHSHDSAIRASLESRLPRLAIWALQHGRLGVQVFFVLSGFVIAASVGSRQITAKFALLFAARRHIRIDPTYWTALAICVADVAVSRLLHSGATGTPSLPSGAAMLSHVFYAQVIAFGGSISPVMWTLCLEMQFYIAFLTLCLATQGAKHGHLVYLFTGLVSLAIACFCDNSLVTPWLFRDWYMFALGVLAYRWTKEIEPGPFPPCILLPIMLGIIAHKIEPIVASAASVLVALAAKNWIGIRWLHTRPMMYLGGISYSLYLTHYTIGSRVINAASAHASINPFIVIAAATAASITGAHVLHALVERPTKELAARLAPKRATELELRPEIGVHSADTSNTGMRQNLGDVDG